MPAAWMCLQVPQVPFKLIFGFFRSVSAPQLNAAVASTSWTPSLKRWRVWRAMQCTEGSLDPACTQQVCRLLKACSCRHKPSGHTACQQAVQLPLSPGPRQAGPPAVSDTQLRLKTQAQWPDCMSSRGTPPVHLTVPVPPCRPTSCSKRAAVALTRCSSSRPSSPTRTWSTS